MRCFFIFLIAFIHFFFSVVHLGHETEPRKLDHKRINLAGITVSDVAAGTDRGVGVVLLSLLLSLSCATDGENTIMNVLVGIFKFVEGFVTLYLDQHSIFHQDVDGNFWRHFICPIVHAFVQMCL